MPPSVTRYMPTVATLPVSELPAWYKVVGWVTASFIILTALILWFTPWIQTAHGQGHIASLDPSQRPQAISALVSGQIKRWHVKEGALVKAGDPIVTLTDIDAQRVEKLQNQLEATQAMLAADNAAITNAIANLKRQRALLDEGIASAKTVEAAQIKLESLRAKAAKSEAEVSAAKMALSRQSTLTKYAPAEGVVTQLIAGGSATFVSAGSPLAQFVPTDFARAVRISVSGLDAPLVFTGAKARLQFEGWPAFQFSGWPGTSTGTFGGEVVYVEPLADLSGRFYVWIQPDSNNDWPVTQATRLGSRAQAWILLEEVSLGYELWRQLNNFPPQQPAPQPAGGQP